MKVNNKDVSHYFASKSLIFIPSATLDIETVELEEEEGERLLKGRMKNKKVTFTATVKKYPNLCIRDTYFQLLEDLPRTEDCVIELEEYKNMLFIGFFQSIEVRNMAAGQLFLNITLNINPTAYKKGTTNYTNPETLRNSKETKVTF